MKTSFNLTAIAVISATGMLNGIVLPDSSWDLNGDLATLRGTAGALSAVGGWTPTYQNYSGGAGSEVLVFPRFSNTQWLAVDTSNLSANGGGSRVNNYTIMMDVRFDSFTSNGFGYNSLYQTNPSNLGDAMAFVTSIGGIGEAGDYISSVNISVNTWYRLAIVRDLTAGTISYYVDGTIVNSISGGSIPTVDGTYSVQLGVGSILMFADNDGETTSGKLASLAVWDVALDATQVAEFGSASTAAIPEPQAYAFSLGCFTVGFLCLRNLSRRRSVRV